MKKFSIFLLVLIAIFASNNAYAAAVPDLDAIRPANHSTIRLLRDFYAPEIVEERRLLGTNYDAIALYSILKKIIMPIDKQLYVSLVLGISLGNGFKLGVCADLKINPEEDSVMRDVIGDALGYVKLGFTVETASLHAPQIKATDAKGHIDAINALANKVGNKKLQPFAVSPAPAAVSYKDNLQEMILQDWKLSPESTVTAHEMYMNAMKIGQASQSNSHYKEKLPQVLCFFSNFPQFTIDLQRRTLEHYKERNSQYKEIWSTVYMFEDCSTSEKAAHVAAAAEKIKADLLRWEVESRRAAEDYAQKAKERAARTKSNGYPKTVCHFPINLSSIYSAVDMQAWMFSNGLSEANDSLRIVEKLGNLFKEEKINEEEFLKRTIAALLGRGKKHLRAFESCRWNDRIEGTIAKEAFERIEGGLRFKESDIAQDSDLYNKGQHIKNLNDMLAQVGVPATAVAPLIPAVGGGTLSQDEAELLQKALAEGWSKEQLSKAIADAEQKRIAELTAAIVGARKG